LKILIAPNAFKDSLSGLEVAQAMAKGVQAVSPDADIELMPVADGGDGLIEIVLDAFNGQKQIVEVNDPLGRSVDAAFCYLPSQKLAIIEMAEASGLRLLTPTERNPLKTSTYGTGQLIKAALDLGTEKILVGLGGSATNDGGIGMANALGISFLDKNSKELPPTGAHLNLITDIDLSKIDQRIEKTKFEAICDVSNPLVGKDGAAHVYGPQKGASPKQVEELDQGLKNLANIIQQKTNVNVRDLKSGGAAGGLGMGLKVFLDADLRPGVDIVLDLLNLDSALEDADLVLTGEGQIDWQTAFGKAPAGVALRAKKHNIPCLAVAGSVGKNIEELYEVGFTAIFSICPGPVTLKDALENAFQNVSTTTEQVVRAYLSGSQKIS